MATEVMRRARYQSVYLVLIDWTGLEQLKCVNSNYKNDLWIIGCVGADNWKTNEIINKTLLMLAG